MRVRLLLTLALAWAAACTGRVEQFRFERGDFAEGRRAGNELTLRARDNKRIDEILDLAVFGDFASSEPLWKIQERLGGQPRDHSSTVSTWTYPADGGLIEIRRVIVQSEGPPVEKWELRYLPSKRLSASDVVPKLASVPESIEPEIEHLAVYCPFDKGLVDLAVENGAVRSVYLAYPGREAVRRDITR